MRQRALVSIFFVLVIFFSSLFPAVYGFPFTSPTNILENEVKDEKIKMGSVAQQGIFKDKEYWAVLVAINNYGGSTLPFSINEITHFKNTMLNGGNWKESNIMMLTDEEASVEGIIHAIEWLESNADNDDVVIFYFVGHGKKEGNTESLLAYGGYISDRELDQYLDAVNGTIITILDSCYSGGFIEDLKQRGRIILTACGADENTYQVRDLESGIFGYFLNLTLESYTKFAEGTFLLTWLFSVSYSEKLSQRYNESYTIHPQFYDGTFLRTRLINRHSYLKNVFAEFFTTLSFAKNNKIFEM